MENIKPKSLFCVFIIYLESSADTHAEEFSFADANANSSPIQQSFMELSVTSMETTDFDWKTLFH